MRARRIVRRAFVAPCLAWMIVPMLALDLDASATPEMLVLLLLAGLAGAPLPEEGVFAWAGWSARTGALPIPVAFGVPFGTVLLLDLAVFEFGRRLGPALRRSRVMRRVPRRKRARMRAFVRRRGGCAVGVARFVMGTRVATFLAAGAAGMSRRRFLAIDAPLLLASGGWPFLLGWALDDAPALMARLGSWARWIVPAVLAALVVVAIRAWRRRDKEA